MRWLLGVSNVTDSCAGEMGVVSRAVWGGMAVWGLIINGSYYVYLTKCVLHLFVDVRIRFRSDRFLPNASLNISLKLIMLIKRLLSLHGLCLFLRLIWSLLLLSAKDKKVV